MAEQAPAPPDDDRRLHNAKKHSAALESTLAELMARRSDALRALTALPPAGHARPPRTDGSSNDDEAALLAAKAIVKEHIRLLHDYNEIRDVGQGLMGIIAESRGVRIKEVHDEFAIAAKD